MKLLFRASLGSLSFKLLKGARDDYTLGYVLELKAITSPSIWAGHQYFSASRIQDQSHLSFRHCEIGRLCGHSQEVAQIEVRQNYIRSAGTQRRLMDTRSFTLAILVDMSQDAMQHLASILPAIDYDLCALTGDYRGRDLWPSKQLWLACRAFCAEIKKPIYGVLGNHEHGLHAAGIGRYGHPHAAATNVRR